MALRGFLQTGQRSCHDSAGNDISCHGSGQDAAFRAGLAWSEKRFNVQGDIVLDQATGLAWARDASLAGFPLTWKEALAFIDDMNTGIELGFSDWRLPNRRELRSLVSHQTRRPSLPEDHPFTNVFANWYWSSTTLAAHHEHAWYVNLDGGRMFYGGKDQAFMVWPVRGAGNGALAGTGQKLCYTESGELIPCDKSGQDGEHGHGRQWPEPRFVRTENGILDRLTNLLWWRTADLAAGPVNWEGALLTVARLNTGQTSTVWRLPNINELESLVDCACYKPALPRPHLFSGVQNIYWSSTTSLYEPDWAWALYLDNGAIGVGQKSFARFHVWAVTSAA